MGCGGSTQAPTNEEIPAPKPAVGDGVAAQEEAAAPAVEATPAPAAEENAAPAPAAEEAAPAPAAEEAAPAPAAEEAAQAPAAEEAAQAPAAEESAPAPAAEEAAPAPKRNIVIITGPPGSGKGTQAPKLVSALKAPQISTGDMLRNAIAAGTEVGIKAKTVMEAGGLVGDDIIMGIMEERLAEADCAEGFLLDGFPRTTKQAEDLVALLERTGESVTSVLALKVPDEVLTERVCGRWIHKSSGRTYHKKFNPPKSLPEGAEASSENMLDDDTGEPLIQREDDTVEALETRLKKYHEETVPVLAYFEPKGVITTIEADKSPAEVSAEVDEYLKKLSGA